MLFLKSAAAGAFLFLLLGCRTGTGPEEAAPTGPIGPGRMLELDLYTLRYHYLRASLDTQMQVTEAGRKLVREDQPEMHYDPQSSSIRVQAAFRPSAWDAYLCVERSMRISNAPDSAEVLYALAFPFEGGVHREYYSPSEAEAEPYCVKYPQIWERDGSFLIPVDHIAFGTFRIHYW